MKVIPCEKNADLERQVREFAEALKEDAHTLGSHGLSHDPYRPPNNDDQHRGGAAHDSAIIS